MFFFDSGQIISSKVWVFLNYILLVLGGKNFSLKENRESLVLVFVSPSNMCFFGTSLCFQSSP